MPALEKARLQEITAGKGPEPIGDSVEVQFNPATLRIQLSNSIEGGRSPGRQVRQYVGASSSVFNLDLEFDTADEGTTDQPVSVLERTRIVEKYIQPKTDGGTSGHQPAKLRFKWGNLIIDGVVESVDMDFDHFAHNGYPLHAKVSLRMKEQRIEFQLEERSGAGRSAQALDGELPPQMAARLGLDPAAWRGLGLDLDVGLELEAGLEVGFEAGLSASLGVDVKAGFEANIGASLEASVGLTAGASVSGTNHLGADASAAVALARAGGISQAIATVKNAAAADAAAAAMSAFSERSPGLGSAPPLAAGAGPGTGGPAAADAASGQGGTMRRRQVDRRAAGFGFGVPLKPQRAPALDARRNALAGASLEPTDVLFTARAHPTSAPWTRLPLDSPVRRYADAVQSTRRPVKRCGCRGTCRHGEKP